VPAQNAPYWPFIALQDALQATQESARLSERVAGCLFACELALSVALDRGAHFGGLGGAETTFAQALASESGEGIVGNAGRLANGICKLQVHLSSSFLSP
jgi:hypothetical protein